MSNSFAGVLAESGEGLTGGEPPHGLPQARGASAGGTNSAVTLSARNPLRAVGAAHLSASAPHVARRSSRPKASLSIEGCTPEVTFGEGALGLFG